MAGLHVFGDDRLGVIVVNEGALGSRLPALRRALGGAFTDVFLPRSVTRAGLDMARAAGFLGVHLWAAVDGLSVLEYVRRWQSDVLRLHPFRGALELNVELGSDEALASYLRETVARLRMLFPNRPLRLNVAARKAPFLPTDLLRSDPRLYVCEQNYAGNMDVLFSSADLLLDMLEVGVPAAKASICYAAFCAPGGGHEPSRRVVALPLAWPLRRGVVFSDDLLADAGML